MSRRSKTFFHVTASFLALAAVVLSSLGIVVVHTTAPGSATTGPGAEAYPCMGSSCGCSTASQCWQSCCCSTPDERLAWAKENDVDPPKSLLELLAVSIEIDLVLETSDCCSSTASAIACSKESSPKGQTAETHTPATRVVLLSSVNRCRGLSNYIAIFGGAICEPIVAFTLSDDACCERLQFVDSSLNSLIPSPPTPPPRVLA